MNGRDNLPPLVSVEGTPLTKDQQARAEALRVARETIAARNPVGQGPVNPYDLMTVANWIIEGGDPLASEEETS